MNLFLKAFFAAVAALALSSCALDPYAGPRAQDGAAGGTVLGAIAGGIIGNQSGRALEGAAIGAIAGNALGYIAGNEQDHYYNEGKAPQKIHRSRSSYRSPSIGASYNRGYGGYGYGRSRYNYGGSYTNNYGYSRRGYGGRYSNSCY